MARDAFISALQAAIGPEQVLVAGPGQDLARFTTDWTGRFIGTGSIVVRPGNHDEVVAVVDICRRFKRALVPQGGNTGLVGGSVPLNGEVLISLTRLRDISEVDQASRHITVGAGVTLAEVQDAAARVGLRYPVDFGARGSATVGGMIATNAGGIAVLRFGMTRQQIRGITAVLGDGSTVSHMTGLVKDNTGYDLTGLLCGSEGTLGIVTAAVLQLVPRAEQLTTVLLGCVDGATAVSIVADLTARSQEIEAAEIMLASGFDVVESAFGFVRPFHASAYVLLDIAADSKRCEALIGSVAVHTGVVATAIANDEAGRQKLWRFRDEHTAAIATLGPPVKLDVTVPLSHIATFIVEITDELRSIAAEARTFVFGHVADGNLHVNVSGAPQTAVTAIEELVLAAVSRRGGSISAEHGIGTMKKDYLHLCRSTAEVAAMRSIKRALDPDGIMNPNVLFAD